MKNHLLRFLVPVCLALSGGMAKSATVTWTNTAGGVWENAANWSPNQVPANGDSVLVTNAGIYTVTNSSSPILSSLLIGGPNGIQTLSGGTVNLTNAGLVASNGVFNWSSGDLEGSLTVAAGGTLTMSNTLYFAQNNNPAANTATLTNFGTVIWAGSVYGFGSGSGTGGGYIVNAGTWESVADNSFQNQYAGSNVFINTGTLEKIGGTSTTTINWNFASTGIIDTPVGTFTMNWNGPSTVNGNFTLGGGTIYSAVTVASNAVMNWANGDLEGSLTVAQGGTLSMSNTLYFSQTNNPGANTSTLTNFGTVIFAGTVYGYGSGSGTGGGLIDNAGIWESVTDNMMANQYSGSNVFINSGTLEKIGGTGTTTINWNLATTGTIDTPTGAFSLTWGAPATLNGNFTLASETFLYPLTVASNAVLNLTSADLESSLTVAPGGTLTVSNVVYFAQNNNPATNTATLTNFGTVVWAGTVVYGYGSPSGLGGGVIENAGIWKSVADTTFQNQYSGTNYFINTGTLEKIGGTGVTTFNWNFSNNGGTIDSPSGSFIFSTWVGTGLVYGTATFSGGSFDGTLAPGAVVNFPASVSGSFTISSNAVANWTGNNWTGASITVASNGLFNIEGGNGVSDMPNSVITNYGTVAWISGTIRGGSTGGTFIYNYGLWDNQNDDIMNGAYGGAGLTFLNFGTVLKSGGSIIGTQLQSGVLFSNTGVIDVEEGVFSLQGSSTFNGGSIVGDGLTELGGGALTGTNVLSDGVLTWVSGTWNGATVTIPSNAVVNIAGGTGNNDMQSALVTNYGTMEWTSGTLRGGSTPATTIYNYGLWNPLPEALFNQDFNSAFGGAGVNFYNFGTFLKSAGTSSVTTMDSGVTFFNTGAIDVEQGVLSLAGNVNFNGGAITGNGLTELNGTLIDTNVLSSGVLTWTSGTWNGATVTIPSNSIVNVAAGAGNDDMPSAVVTNYGTILWTSGTLRGGATPASYIYNYGMWNAESDEAFNEAFGGTGVFIDNEGTFLKSAGSSTGTGFQSGVIFSNNGTVNVQAGILSLTGNSLVAGVLNFGINGSNNFGQLVLSGPVTLGGAITANLNNGFVPPAGSVFGVLSYGSETGGFTNAIFPAAAAWQTNYGATTFSLTVQLALAAITNQTVNELALMSVTAHASDAMVPPESLTYALAAAPPGMTINGSTGLITWTPAQTNSPSTNTVVVTATDTGIPVLNATNSFSVVVQEVNVAPTPPAITRQTNNELALLTVNNAAIESNIHATTTGYALTAAPTGMSISAGGEITWTPTQTQSPSTNTVTIVVTNQDLLDAINPQLTSTNSFIVVVREINVAPVLTSLPPQSVNELALLSVTNSASETNIHATTTSWSLTNAPAGMTISASGVITWTPSQTNSPSTNVVGVVAQNTDSFDFINPHLSTTNTLTIFVNEVNTAPVPPVLGPTTVNELTLVKLTNTASEANIHATNLNYSLINPPAGAAIDTNGIFTWTPAQTQSPSTNVITAVVINNDPYDLTDPSLAAINTFTVIVKEVNVAPVLAAIPTQTVPETTLFTLTNAATETNIHATLAYGLTAHPTGMSINPATGVITWTPGQNQSPSTNTVTTIVTNTDTFDTVNPHLTATNTFSVVVIEANMAPTMPVTPNTNVNELTLLTVTNTATDSDIHATLSYALLAPPAGASIDTNGVITWTPAQTQSPSTNTITVAAISTDLADQINPRVASLNSFTVVVQEVNVAPALPVIATQTVNQSVLLTVTNAATESNIHATLAYGLVSPPTGMTISASGVITWTPSQGPSTNVITTIVTNTDSFDTVHSHLTATNQFTVIVYAPTLALISNHTVNVGQTISFTAVAADNDSTRTLTYSLVGAPSLATIGASSGTFSWRPGVASANTINSITVKVSDNSNPVLTATQSFNVNVNALTTVTMSSLTRTAGQAQMQVSGPQGPDYVLQASATLTNTVWSSLSTNTPGTLPFTDSDTNAGAAPQRFYRIQLGP